TVTATLAPQISISGLPGNIKLSGTNQISTVETMHYTAFLGTLKGSGTALITTVLAPQTSISGIPGNIKLTGLAGVTLVLAPTANEWGLPGNIKLLGTGTL